MKRLCLVRHAIAGERGPAWPDDRLRPLTAEGRAKMEQAAQGLVRLAPAGALLSSPLVRAVQTAEILSRALCGMPIERCDALATGDHAALLAAAAARPEDDVFAVGHEPYISSALAWLLTGDTSGAAFDVKKGSATMVAFDGQAGPGEGILEWMATPRILRGLAAAG